uniref:Uncharacterized protein n=1 Tax=Avena sativa TaxID=4498 RepID=A0ACD6AIM9_AVESA
MKESSTTATSSSTPQALLPNNTETSASPGRCLSSSPRSTILLHEHPDWYLKFYIRTDRSASFHTYPDVGGPFKSLQEARNAIDCHLHGLEHKTMCKDSLDKLSPMDRLIQRSLYWPDGSRRKCSEASAYENTRTETGHLLKALVDKYNEDHELSADRAYELKDALHYQTMREGCIFYSHFNFTAKAKGAGGIDLFFAEVMEGDEMAVSCFCMIDTDANGILYSSITF